MVVLAEQIGAQAEEDEAAGQELRLLPHATPEGACTERKNFHINIITTIKIRFLLILYQKQGYRVYSVFFLIFGII